MFHASDRDPCSLPLFLSIPDYSIHVVAAASVLGLLLAPCAGPRCTDPSYREAIPAYRDIVDHMGYLPTASRPPGVPPGIRAAVHGGRRLRACPAAANHSGRYGLHRVIVFRSLA